jgi:hypothetical protein
MNQFLAVSIALTASVLLNFWLFFRAKSIIPKQTIDAKDLIHDITTRGSAIVRITVIDPEGLFQIKGTR